VGVEVSDTGPGIAETERAAVLRRFYRAEKSRHEQGSGLGLSLVAAVARLHGLQIAIEDAMPGCRVTLPGDGVDLRSDGQQIRIAEGA
jgi:signal transduction histidine kinase